MGKEIITSVNIEVEKHKFYQCKNPISIYDVNVDRIVVSKKVFFKKVLNILMCMKMMMKK